MSVALLPILHGMEEASGQGLVVLVNSLLVMLFDHAGQCYIYIYTHMQLIKSAVTYMPLCKQVAVKLYAGNGDLPVGLLTSQQTNWLQPQSTHTSL